MCCFVGEVNLSTPLSHSLLFSLLCDSGTAPGCGTDVVKKMCNVVTI